MIWRVWSPFSHLCKRNGQELWSHWNLSVVSLTMCWLIFCKFVVIWRYVRGPGLEHVSYLLENSIFCWQQWSQAMWRKKSWQGLSRKWGTLKPMTRTWLDLEVSLICLNSEKGWLVQTGEDCLSCLVKMTSRGCQTTNKLMKSIAMVYSGFLCNNENEILKYC